MPKTIWLIPLVLLAINPAYSQEIYQRVDNFSGVKEFYTKNRLVKLEGGSFLSERYVNFSFHAISPADASTPYMLMVNTNTKGWIFIASGNSLTLKLDGAEMMPLSGPGSQGMRSVLSGDTVTEAAAYLLSAEQLDRISRAKTVDFRLTGTSDIVTGAWKPDLLSDASSLAQRGPSLLVMKDAGGGTVVADTGPANASTSVGTATVTCPPPPPGSNPLRLGVSVAPINSFVANQLKMDRAAGVVVVAVTPGSAAEISGLRAGDVMLRMGEKTIKAICDVGAIMSTVEKGSTLPITVWRAGSEASLQAHF